MGWKLEVVVVPVADVDRARHFYGDRIGFSIDHDIRISDDMHIVQLTPPLRHRRRSGRTARARRGGQPGPALRRRRDPGLTAGRGLELVRLLQRSRRQRLGGAAEPQPRLVHRTARPGNYGARHISG